MWRAACLTRCPISFNLIKNKNKKLSLLLFTDDRIPLVSHGNSENVITISSTLCQHHYNQRNEELYVNAVCYFLNHVNHRSCSRWRNRSPRKETETSGKRPTLQRGRIWALTREEEQDWAAEFPPCCLTQQVKGEFLLSADWDCGSASVWRCKPQHDPGRNLPRFYKDFCCPKPCLPGT